MRPRQANRPDVGIADSVTATGIRGRVGKGWRCDSSQQSKNNSHINLRFSVSSANPTAAQAWGLPTTREPTLGVTPPAS